MNEEKKSARDRVRVVGIIGDREKIRERRRIRERERIRDRVE